MKERPALENLVQTIGLFGLLAAFFGFVVLLFPKNPELSRAGIAAIVVCLGASFPSFRAVKWLENRRRKGSFSSDESPS